MPNFEIHFHSLKPPICTLSEAWSGVDWADLMAAQGALGTDFFDRSTRTIVGTMLWTEYIDLSKKSVPKAPWAAMRSAQFTPLQASDRSLSMDGNTFSSPSRFASRVK